MCSRIQRALIGVLFAAFATAITLVAASAQASGPTATPSPTAPGNADNCASCHKVIHTEWQSSPHGQSMTDPVFVQDWTSQGKPGACLVCHATGYDPATGAIEAQSVSCIVCHSPMPANHPTDPMPTNTSADLCGMCHSDPRFATAEWKLSAHFQRNMTCTTCHDQHTASIKVVSGAPAGDDGSALCENCHKDAMQNFPVSKHAQAGVTCVNCHLGFSAGNQSTNLADFVSVHKAPDHSFIPTLDTCNQCHSTQMHSLGKAVWAAAIKAEVAGGTPTPQPTAVVTPIPPATNTPAAANPFAFGAVLFGVLGVAGGVVVEPWLGRAYRKYTAKGGRHE